MRYRNRAHPLDARRAALGHRENAHLLGGTKSILARAKQTKELAAVTFEGEHDIDQVFEYPRPRDRSFLGDVPDEDQRCVAGLRDRGKLRRAFAHLRDGSGRRLDPIRAQRLDRIDHHHRWLSIRPGRHDRLDAGLGKNQQIFRDRGEALRAQPQLLGALFSCDVEDRGSRSQCAREL